MILSVPSKFQQRQSNTYPPDNFLDFEHWLANNMRANEFPEELIYLPICWTSYFVNSSYGRSGIKMAELNRFLRKLDKSKKYWTVVQYDDGIITEAIQGIDLKVFSMVDGVKDYPIPLLCQPHRTNITKFAKPFFANFVGSKTHPIREKMMHTLQGMTDYYLSSKPHNLTMYCNAIANSTFTLCPRGYGPTSFRIMEAVHLRSIPVYISDVFVEPYHIDFDEYGVKIPESEIKNIDEILRAVDVNAKKIALSKHRNLFTYEGCKQKIIQQLNDYDTK